MTASRATGGRAASAVSRSAAVLFGKNWDHRGSPVAETSTYFGGRAFSSAITVLRGGCKSGQEGLLF
jgi:hypothetical protein